MDITNQKLDSITKFYSGAKAYCMFLIEQHQQDGANVDYILDEELYNCARLGFIINIILSIKEDLVEKVSYHNFKSLIFLRQLEESVEVLATKTNNGYVIDNYTFDTAANLVATLRDKLAHGNFIINEKGKEITLFLNDGNQINISVESLYSFIYYAMMNFLKKQDTKEYVNNKIVFSKIKNGTTSLKTKSDIRFVCKNVKRVTLSFKRKDGANLTEKEVKRLDAICQMFNTNSDEQFLNTIYELTKYTYDFTYTRKPVTNINYDLITEVVTTFYKNVTLPYQLNRIALMIEKMLDDENQLQEIMASANNLSLLNAIYENKSTDMKYVESKLNDKIIENGIVEIANAGIVLFQSLFSYANDDVYVNDFEYQQKENNGLDYGKLDLSKLNVLVYPTDKNPLLIYLEQKNAKEKEYINVQKRIDKIKNNIENIKKTNNKNALTKVYQTLQALKQEEQIVLKEKIQREQEYNEAYLYAKNNNDHLLNRSIINGIRNSIAHGNYRISQGKKLEDVKLVFEDIHNNKLTFKAEISPTEFINMIYENDRVISEFLQKNTCSKTLKKEK